jgi:hypothetical protein
MALKGIAERPVLGWGQENFNYVFNKYYNPQMFGQEEWFDRTHNVVLDWLIAGERRLRASKLAGLIQVPVIIRMAEEQSAKNDLMKLELAIIENVQREDGAI